MPTLIGGVPVYVSDGGIYWVGPAAVDADGAPNAYCLDDPAKGLDDLRNARSSAGWVGILTEDGEPTGKPLRQSSGPYAGYPVSPTSLRDKTRPFAREDASQYVDAATRAYIAVPPELRALGVLFGDVGMLVRRGTGGCCAFVVADGGPHNKLGEVSIAAADALTFPSSPRDGGIGGKNLLTVVFPKSAKEPRWPRTEEDVAEQAAELFGAWGGLARALAMLG